MPEACFSTASTSTARAKQPRQVLPESRRPHPRRHRRRCSRLRATPRMLTSRHPAFPNRAHRADADGCYNRRPVDLGPLTNPCDGSQMALEDRTLKLCNCNKTIPIDAVALARALKSAAPIAVHTELCRKEIEHFTSALKDDLCVIGCTQEAPLFAELAERSGASAALKFVNIREAAGWSAEGAQAAPKIAALLALADAPESEPVPGIRFNSGGHVLVIGPAEAALDWAERLSAELEVSGLIARARGGELPAQRRYPVWSGKPKSVTGWLGAFEVAWEQVNPIDLDLCTRCNACIRACPETAIGY